MLRISVKQLTEEYLTLTGRPAPTLTVDEFTLLYRLALEMGGSGNMVSSPDEPSVIPSPANNNVYPLPENKQEKVKTTAKTGVEESGVVSTKDTKLAILRSVSG